VADEVIGRGLIEILPDFKKFGKELASSMRTARSQLDGSAAGLRASAGTIFTSMSKVGKGVSVVGIGVAAASVKMAGNFQAETAVLQTAAGETAANLGKVRAGILNISKGTGTGLQNLTDGMYTVEKAGYRGAQGLQVLKAAAQGAKEENAKLSDVTNAMTSVMASYHLKATDSTRVMNALKTAAGEGKITMEEFSGALSTVLPIASANKISFDQVAGAVATLTQHGTSAREATHELSATIRQLAAPNNVAVKEMARFGLTAQDVSLNLGKKGLTGTIDELVQVVLAKMGPSGKVLLSSFNTTKQAGDALNAMLQKMPKSLQDLAKQYQSGKIASDDWKMAIKGLPVDQKNLINQYVTLTNKNKGFSDELRKGGPATKTFTEAIKKMSGGAIGLNTVLQLSGESQAGFNERVKKVGESYNNASKDVEGWKTTQGLLNTQIARMKQTVQVLMIQLGTKLIPILSATITWLSKNRDVVYVLAGAIAGVLTLAVVSFAATTVISVAKMTASFAKLGASGAMLGVNLVRGFASASAAASSSTGLAGSLGGSIRKALSPSTYTSAFSTLRLRGMYAVDGLKSGFRSVGTAAASMATTVKGAAVSAGTSAWSGITSGVSAVGTAMKTSAIATRDFAKAQYESIVANTKAAVAWTISKAKTLAQATATAVATAAQWLWNVAMDANPIALIIIGITALIGVIILIATKTTWFQTIWKYTWGAITTAFSATVNFIKDHWKLIIAIILGPIALITLYVIDHWKQISSGFAAIISYIRNHWVLIVSIITGPIGTVTLYVIRHWNQIIDGAKSMISSLAAWFRGLPNRVSGAVGKLSRTLYNAGSDLVGGLLSGARSKLSALGSWAKGVKDSVVGAIKHVFGIKSPSTVMMGLGGHMMTGLLKGLLRGKGVLNSVVKGIFHGPLDAAKALVKNGIGVAGFLGKNAAKLTSQLFGDIGSTLFDSGSGNGVGGSNQTLGKKIMLAMGFQAREWNALNRLWIGESGWRTNALNASSGAYGIPQALPASKMGSAGSDWRTNPATQIEWGLNYIRSRYGTPSFALSAWLDRSPHWYDNGGMLPKGLSLVMNGTGAPERIRNARQEAALQRGGSGVVINLTVVNKGVIGSKQDALNFLVEALDTLGRQNRIPRSVTGG
jgi:TP901 family phage tail tape measure protein